MEKSKGEITCHARCERGLGLEAYYSPSSRGATTT